MRALEVGAVVRKHRKARNWTQIDLASKIGVQQSDLSRMERGEYRVSLEALFCLLDVFGLDFDEFFASESARSEFSASVESELIARIRDLEEDQKRALLGHLTRMTSSESAQEAANS